MPDWKEHFESMIEAAYNKVETPDGVNPFKRQDAIYQLMSASEAREKSSENISRTCQSELQAAMEYIYNSVNDGKTECWCYTYLHEQCINKLRELGYDVSNHSTQRDGTLFKIKW